MDDDEEKGLSAPRESKNTSEMTAGLFCDIFLIITDLSKTHTNKLFVIGSAVINAQSQRPNLI